MGNWLTIAQAAAKWGVSPTVVRKWIHQGRVKAERAGRTWLVLDTDRPTPLGPGERLTPDQRAGWQYGKKYRPVRAGGA